MMCVAQLCFGFKIVFKKLHKEVKVSSESYTGLYHFIYYNISISQPTLHRVFTQRPYPFMFNFKKTQI